MDDVKGIIDFYLNFNEIEKIFSKLDLQQELSDYLYSKNSISMDSIFCSTASESLKKSFDEVINIDKVLYRYNDVDNYIIYFNRKKELKLSIIWKSNQNLINVVEKIPKLLKQYFRDIFKETCKIYAIRKIDYLKSRFVLFTNHLITENTVLYYAFFKNSSTRDNSVSIDNLNIKITYKLLDKAKIWNFILLIFGNILIFSFVPKVSVTTILTSILTLLCFLITDYLFNKKCIFSIDISSLTFNEDPKQINAIADTPVDELRNMPLNSEGAK
ncbi:MAG: hypothetical protein ACRCZW_14045 [Lactobacillaceae bacterium]